MTQPSFSEVLKNSTWSDHESAEGDGYLKALMAGRLSREAYGEMVAQHYFAYVALDAASRALADDPVAAPFVFPELYREEALARDLETIYGADWADRIEPSLPTRTLVARINQVASWPGGYVAHHYTRYLGDLSGGQFIRMALEKIYGYGPGGGVDFYRFDAVGSLPGSSRSTAPGWTPCPWTRPRSGASSARPSSPTSSTPRSWATSAGSREPRSPPDGRRPRLRRRENTATPPGRHGNAATRPERCGTTVTPPGPRENRGNTSPRLRRREHDVVGLRPGRHEGQQGGSSALTASSSAPVSFRNGRTVSVAVPRCLTILQVAAAKPSTRTVLGSSPVMPNPWSA
nr:hypothetical protein GCM10020093_003610 [Planobispora longispora]